MKFEIGNYIMSGDSAYKIIKIDDNKIIAVLEGTNIIKEFDIKNLTSIENISEDKLD